MREQSRWVRYQMQCPEQRGASQLLLEWRVKSGGEVLNSVSCDNPQLKDLSGSECQWSCWEQITRAKG
jgi:hypothetical protein